MTQYCQKNISVIEPISEAIQKTKQLLFEPFDIKKWFVIGFGAWLVHLFRESFGSGINMGFHEKESYNQAPQVMTEVTSYVHEHIILIAISAVAAVIVFVALMLACLWLSSRGRFIFLDCTAKNKAEIKKPWQNFQGEAMSLFKFRIVLVLTGLVLFTLINIPVGITIIALKNSRLTPLFGISIIALIAVLGVCVFAVFATAATLLNDFVVPIMYLRRCKCLAAWKEFLALLTDNCGRFMLYILVKIVIFFCITMIVSAVLCLGCCCCCIWAILLLPYLGTVAMLPLLSFKRFYSLCYLRQYDPAFDVFA